MIKFSLPQKSMVVMLLLCACLPLAAWAQIPTGAVDRMHVVLEDLLKTMSLLCKDVIDVARAIGGFGALWYIGVRVWRHIAAAEPIDFFPLLKPFVIAIVISLFPQAMNLANSILKPLVLVTDNMVKDANKHIKEQLDKQQQSIFSPDNSGLAGGIGQNPNGWYEYQNPDGTNYVDPYNFGQGMLFSLDVMNNAITYVIKLFFSWILQILYFAASLCINAMRTFHLIILTIIGPFVLCISMYDGFGHTLVVWLARYINVYMWLPVCNLLSAMIGKIYQGMLIAGAAPGAAYDFSQTDVAYLIFLVIAIFSYFSVPSIANYIVHASGGNTIMQKISSVVNAGAKYLVLGGGAGAAVAAGATAAGSIASDGPGPDTQYGSMADAKNSEPYQKDSSGSSYQRDKLAGK